MRETKLCERCGGPVPHWRRFCSHDCYVAALRGAPTAPHPPCVHCGGQVVRRKDERPRIYRQRQCCSKRCAHAARQATIARSRLAPAREPLAADCFAAHNLVMKDGGLPRLYVPETHVFRMASS